MNVSEINQTRARILVLGASGKPGNATAMELPGKGELRNQV